MNAVIVGLMKEGLILRIEAGELKWQEQFDFDSMCG